MNEPGKVCLLFLLRTQKAGTLVGMHCSFFSLATFNTLKKTKNQCWVIKLQLWFVCDGGKIGNSLYRKWQSFSISLCERRKETAEKKDARVLVPSPPMLPSGFHSLFTAPMFCLQLEYREGTSAGKPLSSCQHTHTCSYVMWWMVRDSLLPSTPTQLSYFLTVEEWNKPPHLLCCSIKKGQSFYSPGCLCGM